MGKSFLSIPESLNTFEKTNVNFKCVQFTRMLMFLSLMALFFANVYIFVKLAMFDFTSWSMFACILAVMYVAFGSGRSMVESKMLKKNKIIAEAEGIDLPEELPKDDRSVTWKYAYKCVCIALPFCLTMPILFNFTALRTDVICQLASYANADV